MTKHNCSKQRLKSVANAQNSSATNHVINNSDNANPGYIDSDSDANSDPSEELRNAPDIWTFGQDYERLLANPNRTTRSGKHFHKEINTASSQNRRGRNPED